MKKIILSLIGALTITACSTTDKVTIDNIPDDTSQILVKNASKYFEIINSINSTEAAKIESSLLINAVAGGKKYNASGRGYYTKDPLNAKIIMNDNIFHFRVMDILVMDSKIKVYYPLEKTLVIDNFSSNADTLNRSTGQSSNVLASLFVGKIPVIEKYKVVKLHEFTEESETFLELENANYSQTISFKNDIPFRVIVKSRISDQNFSIKYSGHFIQSDCHFFKTIEIVSRNPYSYIKINYTKTTVNGKFIPETTFVQKVPSDTKIVDLTE
ncbi:MAG: hypothetical protein JW982_03305 [Spirochaetes bacterium]|nr:hypothetical protein [Spirochaetota bacterium]